MVLSAILLVTLCENLRDLLFFFLSWYFSLLCVMKDFAISSWLLSLPRHWGSAERLHHTFSSELFIFAKRLFNLALADSQSEGSGVSVNPLAALKHLKTVLLYNTTTCTASKQVNKHVTPLCDRPNKIPIYNLFPKRFCF